MLFVDKVSVTPNNVFDKVEKLTYMKTDSKYENVINNFTETFFETYQSRSFTEHGFVSLFVECCAIYTGE